jgi:AraC family transcriptional regulator
MGPVFEALWKWVEAHSVPATRSIGIYYDNPDFVPANQLRAAACAEVPASFQIGERDGLPLILTNLEGGSYATTRFTGPYEDLAPVWTQLTEHVEGTMRKKIRDTPAFEVYVNDPEDTPPAQLVTELYMPVR